MVEGNGLENRRARKGTVGSNPTLSAKLTNATPSDRITASIPAKREKAARQNVNRFVGAMRKTAGLSHTPERYPSG